MTKIVTHNGKFHADESLAVALLSKIYQPMTLTRTRDPKIIEMADIVVDVGGIYDSKIHRYDHHQSSFQDTFSSFHKTRLSSAGLVYKHFGRQLIAMTHELVEDELELVYIKMYERFVEAFDGVDNGIERFEGESKLVERYCKPYDIFDMVSDLNPYNDDLCKADEQFQKAVALVGQNFDQVLSGIMANWLPARNLVLQALNSADERFLVFDTPCSWKEHLLELEPQPGHVLYVVYQDGTSGSWRIQAVPVREGSFESRKALPTLWRGLRDKELDEVVEIEGCVFVHVTGFIGGHKTREGAISMAQRAILFK